MGKLTSLALVAKINKFDSRLIFAGWTDDSLPMVTMDKSDLSSEAIGQMQTFLQSGYPLPVMTLKKRLEVVALEFAGPVQDLKDMSPENIVQDTIIIDVKDSQGKQFELTLGELEVLNMIGNNMLLFQKTGSVLDTTERQEAVVYYSFFLPGLSGTDIERQDLLVLIKPTNENIGNIVDTILFMQDVIKKLLKNDENQPPGFRKGYLTAGLEAEKEIVKEFRRSKGLLGFAYVPDGGPKDSLKKMIMDFVTVPADGSKPKNFFMVPEQKVTDVLPNQETLQRMRLTAARMYLYAKSKIRNVR